MKLHELKSTIKRPIKRVGRGYGSGKGGHNSGRGTKGQKSRGKVPAYFVGTSWVWFKRLPFIRGKSKFVGLTTTRTVTLTELNRLPAGSIVTAELLNKTGIISRHESASAKIKIVGTGKLDKKLILKVTATSSAVHAVQAAGGEYSVQNA